MSASTLAFTWQAPTRIRSGPRAVSTIGQEAAALGSCALVAIDAGVRHTPMAEHALTLLREHGVEVPVVHSLTGVPTLERARELVAAAATHRVNLVVGIGGGSAMDLSKVVSLGATNPRLLADQAWQGASVLDHYQDGSILPALPTLLVPTTAATGSEVNVVAAVQHAGQRRLLVCGALAPATAILDPRMLSTLPVQALLEGVVETFTRVLGPYLSDDRAPHDTGDRLCEALCQQALDLGEQLAAGRREASTDADVLWLNTVTGTHVATAGRHDWGHTLWYLQDTVGALTGLPKGPAMAALLPAYLSAIASGTDLGAYLGHRDRLASMVRALRPHLGQQPADAAVATRALLHRWGLPSNLTDVGLADADGIDRLTRLTHRRWAGTGRLRGATLHDFAAFFTAAAQAGPGPAPPQTPRHTPVPGPVNHSIEGGER